MGSIPLHGIDPAHPMLPPANTNLARPKQARSGQVTPCIPPPDQYDSETHTDHLVGSLLLSIIICLAFLSLSLFSLLLPSRALRAFPFPPVVKTQSSRADGLVLVRLVVLVESTSHSSRGQVGQPPANKGDSVRTI
jgi:hypothetical protein